MPEVTIGQFADAIGIPIERLQEQLIQSGVSGKNTEDIITDVEKSSLLNYLRSKRGQDSAESKKITLKRRTSEELRIPVNTHSRNKTKLKIVNVETKKKRTYIKRVDLDIMRKAEFTKEDVATQEDVPTDVTNKDSVGTKLSLDKIVAADSATKEVVPADVANKDSVDAEVSSDKIVAADSAIKEVVPADVANKDVPLAKKETNETASVTALKKKESPNTKPRLDKKGENKGRDKSTRYGRDELHVASEKSGRRKKRSRHSNKIIPKIDVQHGFEKPTQPVIREVRIVDHISVNELAQQMSVKAVEVIKFIMELGSTVTVNQILDKETAALVVEEMGHKAKIINESALEDDLSSVVSQGSGKKVPRFPIVTVMGHVDHGKTTLLDYIRNSQMVDSEAGGITQHIGAYVVESSAGQITFLDTPGHEAFTSMRARGASITDIVVLVVAADDGVMPQTKEAVEHAKNSGVPIIVAVNKIDKENADIEQVQQGLSHIGVISEDWGGETQFVNISSKTGAGIDRLLECISLQAELLELHTLETGSTTGVVIEARLDKGLGPVATILVRSGALNKGDIILSGKEFGHVRAMIDYNGNELLSSVGPSMPVEILGLSGIPYAGDEMVVVSDEKKAREIAELRKNRSRESILAKQQAIKLQTAMNQMSEEKRNVFNVMVKADTHGTAEAIVDALNRLSTDAIKVDIISSGVGGITETDMNLAFTSKAMIVGFNVRADASARKISEEALISVRYYSIVYDLLNDVEILMNGILEPELSEKIIGIAEVKDVFRSPKFGEIAGCIVTTGLIRKDSPIRVLRDNVVVYEGELESLRRFKDNISEVKSGTECGIGIKNYTNIRAGDQIEVFERIKVARKI